MPEGDTIHRTARTLQRALGGKHILSYASRLDSLRALRLTGRRIEGVRARGKNVLIDFEGGGCLHTHMLMSGSWHIYRKQDRWRKPQHFADIVIETNPWSAVGFSIPLAEYLSHEHRSALLRRLGPDLLGEVHIPDLVPRLRTRRAALGEVLMDQTLVAGIGNVYKSELCFIHGFNPFQPVQAFTDEELGSLLAEGRRLLHRNLHGSARVTTTRSREQRLWVYGRAGEACLRCSDRIAMRRQGDAGRSTYYCPSCQRFDAKRRTTQPTK